jgi:GNAT superfamily N-acetyltransferase
LTTATVRFVEREDIEPIKRLAIDNHMSEPDDVGFIGDTISAHLDGTLPDDRWFIAETHGRLTGAAYVAPEPFGHLVWNPYFLATEPSSHGQGVGSLLVSTVAQHLENLGAGRAHVLIVETSATDHFAGARDFHEATDRGDYQGSAQRENARHAAEEP